MASDLLFSLWFFLPAGIANVTPILVAKAPGLRQWTTPIDLGVSWRGKRLFGDHKTWRGIVCGLISGTLIVWLQASLFNHYPWARTISQPVDYASLSVIGLGLSLSLGALGGDALKSFAKRQFNVHAGDSWFPFDQLDYIVGGLLLSALVIQLPLKSYVWITVVWFTLHLLFSYLGYRLHFKEQPI